MCVVVYSVVRRVCFVLVAVGCFGGGDWFESGLSGSDIACRSVEVLTPEASPGGKVQFKIVLVNQGPVDSPNFRSVVRLTASDRYDPLGPVVGEFLTSVGGKAKRDSTRVCTIPHGTPPGEYRVAVKLDVYGDVDETDESNNTFVSPSTVTVRPSIVDIVAEEVEPSAGVLYVGEENPAAVSAKLANLGPDVVGPFDYLVTLEPGAVKVAEGTVDGLWNDAAVALTVSAVLDESVAEAGYYLVLSADPLDAVPETNESNNVVASQGDVTLRRRVTDVYPVELEALQTEVPRGGTLELRVVLACAGPDAAPGFDALFKLWRYCSNCRVELGEAPFEQVEAGSEVEVVVSFDIPWEAPLGAFYPKVIVDPDDELSETDEMNNSLMSSTTVTVREACFDIAIADVRAGEHAVKPDEQLAVTVAFENPAPDRSPGFDCSLCLSSDQALSEDDALLDRRSMEGLDAGERRKETLCVAVPGGFSSPCYVIAFADPDDVLVETDESNNVGLDDEPVAPPGKKWAVITGIAQYPYVDPPFADDDARQIYAELLESDEYAASRMALLINSRATEGAIRTAVEDFGAQMAPEDTLVFFFSGEGWHTTDLPPYDEVDGYDEYVRAYDAYDYGPEGQILDDELVQWFTQYVPPGAKVCVMIQGCRSGGMRNDFELLDDVVALLGCAEAENCWSDYALQSYGIFAYYTIEAFNDAGADANGDGALSAEEIYSYAEPRTVEYLQGSGVSEHPQMVDCCDGELGVRKAQ